MLGAPMVQRAHFSKPRCTLDQRPSSGKVHLPERQAPSSRQGGDPSLTRSILSGHDRLFAGGVPACAPLNRVKKAFDKTYSGGPASGNAGWLEILCFGVMTSAASAARFSTSALDQSGGVRKSSLNRNSLSPQGLHNRSWSYFAERRAPSRSSIAIRIR
jgi:hypothetical protein